MGSPARTGPYARSRRREAATLALSPPAPTSTRSSPSFSNSSSTEAPVVAATCAWPLAALVCLAMASVAAGEGLIIFDEDADPAADVAIGGDSGDEQTVLTVGDTDLVLSPSDSKALASAPFAPLAGHVCCLFPPRLEALPDRVIAAIPDSLNHSRAEWFDCSARPPVMDDSATKAEIALSRSTSRAPSLGRAKSRAACGFCECLYDGAGRPPLLGTSAPGEPQNTGTAGETLRPEGSFCCSLNEPVGTAGNDGHWKYCQPERNVYDTASGALSTCPNYYDLYDYDDAVTGAASTASAAVVVVGVLGGLLGGYF